MDWPAGFLWGTGASSTQTDGAAPASDWWDWERSGHAPLSGDGNGFATRYPEDFRAVADLGLTHHRLSIEWARIEPEEGRARPRRDRPRPRRARGRPRRRRDAVGLPAPLHPAALVRRARRLPGRGQPHHLLAPPRRIHGRDLRRPRGRLEAGERDELLRRRRLRRRRLAARHTDRDERALAAEQIHLATAEAAAVLRGTGAPVASVFGLSCEVPLDDDEATAKVAGSLRTVNWDAGIGLFRDGVLRVPGRAPVERPTSPAASICSASPTTRPWASPTARSSATPPTPRSPRWATASGPTASAWSSIGSTKSCRAPRC